MFSGVKDFKSNILFNFAVRRNFQVFLLLRQEIEISTEPMNPT